MNSSTQTITTDTTTNILHSYDSVMEIPLLVDTDSAINDSSFINYFDTNTHKLITQQDSLKTELREGIYSEKRATTPADNPWVMSLLILTFVFFAFSYRRGAKYLHHVFTSLFNAKSRGNLFDETTINENQLRLSLLTLTFITEGIVLYHAIINPLLANNNFILPLILICIAICSLYYLLQRGIYNLLGNIFSSRQQTSSFLESFTSVNLFIGLFFTPFTLIIIFATGAANIATIICSILYILSRLIIIYKGIRFFLPHIYNLLYIILYLCALEIIPLLLIKKLVLFVFGLFSF